MKHKILKTKILTIVLLPLASLLLAKDVLAATLTTPSFKVTITSNCSEGNVTCDNVTYYGRDLNTGKSIRLRGRTVHRMCADRVTPCQFLGYDFRNGVYRYEIRDRQLRVYQGKKLVVDEQGTWQTP